MKQVDALIIGCGLSGAVVARNLAERGNCVEVWEKREHIGGNMYDYVDEYGILVHKYGPHTFHTKNKNLYEYMCRFAEWDGFHLTCGAEIDGKYTPTPFNFQTIDDYYSPDDAIELKHRIKAAFGERKTATVVEVLEHPDPIVRAYAEFLFEKDYAPYTAKQWGVSPSEIDSSVLKRVPLRFTYEDGYFDDAYQVMPRTSYTDFFKNLLQHPNITVNLKVDALDHLRISKDSILVDESKTTIPVIYTGALDELFGCCEGNLPYRSLHFEWKHENIDSKQRYPVVAYPQADDYTRITEYKKLPVQDVCGTSYAVEYPLQYTPRKKQEPYYPILTDESKIKYQKYLDKAKRIANLYWCGRLADFKYYNMDQALSRALDVCRSIDMESI